MNVAPRIVRAQTVQADPPANPEHTRPRHPPGALAATRLTCKAIELPVGCTGQKICSPTKLAHHRPEHPLPTLLRQPNRPHNTISNPRNLPITSQGSEFGLCFEEWGWCCNPDAFHKALPGEAK